MTADEFREIALSQAGAVEAAHMKHPDFRVGGKIFATLGYPTNGHAVVFLPPEEQMMLIDTQPHAFALVAGAWGKRGATQINLAAAEADSVAAAVRLAWRKRAPASARKKGTQR